MKTTGISGIPKFGLLDFLGHPITDEGLDAQAKLGLAVCSRTVRGLRAEFSEVAHTLHLDETMSMPSQSTMDNCDTKGSHTTVEYIEVEKIDTSHLSTEEMQPEDVLKLFSPELVLLGGEQYKVVREHLTKVLQIGVARALVKVCPDLVGNWEQLLPRHHSHPLSHIRPEEASIRLVPPHYRQVHRDTCRRNIT